MDKVEKIKELLEDLRPFLNQDGGDIEFIKYEDNYEFNRHILYFPFIFLFPKRV